MKNGFTLAELMVTLGLIGVVTAITLPSLINNATDAKVGPSLAKAVASFEHANKILMSDQDVDALTDTDLLTALKEANIDSYINALSDYMYVEKNDSNSMVSEEGFKYTIETNSVPPVASSTPYLQEITDCIIDINGDEGPGVDGTDVFYFKLMNDGTLQPFGANNVWNSKCPVGSVPSDPKYCAGHIFENNFKVLYE